jgi:heme/copper-type cytochrome/quinol oxidase subunit 3
MALSDHLRAKDWTFSATSRAAQRRNEIALNLLIASLAMFFAAALIGYLMIRFGQRRELPEVELPGVLWLSTGLAIAGSTFLRRALRSVRRERQDLFRPQLLVAFLLGAGFCLSQSVGLTIVLQKHVAAMKDRPATAQEDMRPKITLALRRGEVVEPSSHSTSSEFPVRNGTVPQPQEARLEGLFFVLILLHALHFVAGMIALTIVTRRGLSGRYDHEYHAGVKLCARYWQFLDVVWITLFGTFQATTFDWSQLADRVGL